jgi:tetratricopeptide (TPR) repeat protein
VARGDGVEAIEVRPVSGSRLMWVVVAATLAATTGGAVTRAAARNATALHLIWGAMSAEGSPQRGYLSTADRFAAREWLQADSRVAQTLRTRVLAATRQFQDAESTLAAAGGWNGADESVRLLLLTEMIEGGEFQRIDQALDLWPGCHGTLALRLLEVAETPDTAATMAERAYETAAKACGSGEIGTRVRVGFARFLSARARFPKAAAAYAEALRLSPHSAPLAAEHARVLMDAGDPVAAIAAATAALDLDPDYRGAAAVRGAAHLAAGNFAAAIRDLAQFDSEAATDPSNRWMLAHAYLRGGHPQSARETLQRLLRDSPDFTPARDLLKEFEAGR